MINYKLTWRIQDGKLAFDVGRIIVFEGKSIHSNGPSRDHNDLITSFAAKYRVSRSSVAGNAYRFYWKPLSKNSLEISPVRKIDEEWVCNNQDEFTKILEDEFKH